MVENEIPDQETPEVEKKVEPIVVSQLLAEVSWVKDGKEKRGVLVVLANTSNDLELLEFNNADQSIYEFLQTAKNKGIITLPTDHPAKDQYQKLKTAKENILPQLSLSSSQIHSRIIELDKISLDDQVDGPDFLQIPIIKIDGEDEVNTFTFSDESLYKGFANAAITTTGEQSVVLIPIQGNITSYILAVALQTKETTTIGHSGPAGERLINEIVSVLFSDLQPRHGGQRRPYLQRVIEHYQIKPEELIDEIITELKVQSEALIKSLHPGDDTLSRIKVLYDRQIQNSFFDALKKELTEALKSNQKSDATNVLLDFFAGMTSFVPKKFNSKKPLEVKIQNDIVVPYFNEVLSLPTVLIQTTVKRVEAEINLKPNESLSPVKALEAIRSLGRILTQTNEGDMDVVSDTAQPQPVPDANEKKAQFSPEDQPPLDVQVKPNVESQPRLQLGSEIKSIIPIKRRFGEIYGWNLINHSLPSPALLRPGDNLFDWKGYYNGKRLTIEVIKVDNDGQTQYFMHLSPDDRFTSKIYCRVNGEVINAERTSNTSSDLLLNQPLNPGDIVAVDSKLRNQYTTYYVTPEYELELIVSSEVDETSYLPAFAEIEEFKGLPVPYQVIGHIDSSGTHSRDRIISWQYVGTIRVPNSHESVAYLKLSTIKSPDLTLYKLDHMSQQFERIGDIVSEQLIPGDHIIAKTKPNTRGSQTVYHLEFLESGFIVSYIRTENIAGN